MVINRFHGMGGYRQLVETVRKPYRDKQSVLRRVYISVKTQQVVMHKYQIVLIELIVHV